MTMGTSPTLLALLAGARVGATVVASGAGGSVGEAVNAKVWSIPGCCNGNADGEGVSLGEAVDIAVWPGTCDGGSDGEKVSSTRIGGEVVRICVGGSVIEVGLREGDALGEEIGLKVGGGVVGADVISIGASVGCLVGCLVGCAVGRGVGERAG